MRFFKGILLIALVLAAVMGGFLLKTFYDAGEFRDLRPHFSGNCRAVEGVLSSEDITIHPRSGVAFISSDDRRQPPSGKIARRGAIFAYDLNAREPRLKDLTLNFKGEFRPHGIGLLTGEEGSDRLFVVNHRSNGHFVEIFEYTGGRLVHIESISGNLMHSPNDVIPVGPRTFYVTNDHGSAEGFSRTLEEYLQLARSNVLYFDGKRFRIVAENLAYANGINASSDGRTLYVAATLGNMLYAYDRDPASGDLLPKARLEVGTGIDNIERDTRGNLWAGCHPKLLTFVKHAKDPAQISPSQVLKITMEKGVPVRAKEIYLAEGEALSASSVAAPFGDKLLIGAVFNPRFLLCTLP
jgi:arylesterase/paraoxonase